MEHIGCPHPEGSGTHHRSRWYYWYHHYNIFIPSTSKWCPSGRDWRPSSRSLTRPNPTHFRNGYCIPRPYGSRSRAWAELGQDPFGSRRTSRWRHYVAGDPLTRRFRRHPIPYGPQEDLNAGLRVAPNSQMKFKITKEKAKLELVFKGLGTHSLQQLHRLIFPPEGNNTPPSFTLINADNELEC